MLEAVSLVLEVNAEASREVAVEVANVRMLTLCGMLERSQFRRKLPQLLPDDKLARLLECGGPQEGEGSDGKMVPGSEGRRGLYDSQFHLWRDSGAASLRTPELLLATDSDRSRGLVRASSLIATAPDGSGVPSPFLGDGQDAAHNAAKGRQYLAPDPDAPPNPMLVLHRKLNPYGTK